MKFGLIGKKLGYSRSKEIHTELASYEYNMIELDENKLEDFIKSNDYSGFNITIPYKKSIIPYCSSLSEKAKRTGSVNTVCYDKERKLHGFNTDYYGFIYACKRSGINPKDMNVLVFGSGGTSETVQAALRDMDAKSINVISRTGENTYDDLSKFTKSDILINTTPVGTYPGNNTSVANVDDFPQCKAVFDVIYNPMRTRLIQDARKRQLKYSNGFPMLVAQAKYASILFTQRNGMSEKDIIHGHDTTDDDIEKIIKKITDKAFNVILIGMPGSGKSSIGKIVAKTMGKKFTDIDTEIENQAGIMIPEIFSKYGEKKFRSMESDIIAAKCQESGQVIASGGGAVLAPQNLAAMKQNGVLIWLKRDLKLLPKHGRPLSKNIDALHSLYAERKSIYEKNSDIQINNDGTLENIAHETINRVNCWIDENGGFR